jgi:hypothetical protein
MLGSRSSRIKGAVNPCNVPSFSSATLLIRSSFLTYGRDRDGYGDVEQSGADHWDRGLGGFRKYGACDGAGVCHGACGRARREVRDHNKAGPGVFNSHYPGVFKA